MALNKEKPTNGSIEAKVENFVLSYFSEPSQVLSTREKIFPTNTKTGGFGLKRRQDWYLDGNEEAKTSLENILAEGKQKVRDSNKRENVLVKYEEILTVVKAIYRSAMLVALRQQVEKFQRPCVYKAPFECPMEKLAPFLEKGAVWDYTQEYLRMKEQIEKSPRGEDQFLYETYPQIHLVVRCQATGEMRQSAVAKQPSRLVPLDEEIHPTMFINGNYFTIFLKKQLHFFQIRAEYCRKIK